MEYFLGIDAGGSKTLGVLINQDGDLIATATSGPANVVENGKTMVKKSIKKLRKLLHAVCPQDVVYSAFGMPSFGESLEADREYYTIIEEELGIQPTVLTNDVVIGWAGGTLGQDGIHIVAGTGTIAYGKHGQKEMRVSGWGSLVGDEGSAYSIGRETLQRVSRQLDGRETPTFLRELVLQKLNLQNSQSFAEWIASFREPKRRTIIASIAPITHEAALYGDPVAQQILQQAGLELSLCVKTLMHKLELENPLVTYSGSVLEKSFFVRDSFTKDLLQAAKTVTLKKAEMHPALGAIILLFITLQRTSTESMFQKMRAISHYVEGIS